MALAASDAESVQEPFRVTSEAAAMTGAVLSLPEGTCGKQTAGEATLTAEVAADDTYHLWARVRWDNSCGNSLTLSVGDGPRRTVGEDHLYGSWHWVRAGRYKLKAGKHTIRVLPREDGVALDQLLLTPDGDFRPVGPVSNAGERKAVRRFADDFSRSPGHGMEAWMLTPPESWRINFSFDPNRIPNQYALTGRAVRGPATALVVGAPWRGARVVFAIKPVAEGAWGCVFDRSGTHESGERVLFEVPSRRDPVVRLTTNTRPAATIVRSAEPERLQVDQWHRIEIERWAWLLRVRVDDVEVLRRTDLPAGCGRIGLTVEEGAAVFDDLRIEEIPWKADDGDGFQIAWSVPAEAKWFRMPDTADAPALIGRAGAIALPESSLPLYQFHQSGGGGLAIVSDAASRRSAGFRTWPNGARAAGLRLTVQDAEASVGRVAARYGLPSEPIYRLGPYHFTRAQVEDPSDYLDFTEEEYEKMAASGDYDKLRRRRKFKPVISRGHGGLWRIRGGRWRVHDGVLHAAGPGEVRHWQEILSDLRLTLRFKMLASEATFRIGLYGGPEPGPEIEVSTASEPEVDASVPVVRRQIVQDDQWHTLRLHARGGELTLQVDGQPGRTVTARFGCGGSCDLRVLSGSVAFDDIEFLVPRRTDEGLLSAFDRREPDWWREGGRWIDHGGIACELASNWVSLLAPEREGMLWTKRAWEGNVQVGFNVQENTQWNGWKSKPSHVHRPFDNIRVALSPGRDVRRGYRLEVNSQDRRKTILYRNDEPVAEVVQDADFPMRYVGGHAPYRPRNSRIGLVRQGDMLRAIVNGREVLKWRDAEPLVTRHVGIGGYRTHINFAHIEVRELRTGQEQSP